MSKKNYYTGKNEWVGVLGKGLVGNLSTGNLKCAQVGTRTLFDQQFAARYKKEVASANYMEPYEIWPPNRPNKAWLAKYDKLAENRKGYLMP